MVVGEWTSDRTGGMVTVTTVGVYSESRTSDRVTVRTVSVVVLVVGSRVLG